MKGAVALAGLLMALAAAPGPAAGRDAPPRLERIVVVERHGVRSPTKGPEALAKYAAQPWPSWPVEPGILTAHGARDVWLMGRWLRADYARRGLWPAGGCLRKGAVHVWADGQDQRTRVSGQALLDGAFPGCGLRDRYGPEGQQDGLFSAGATGLCPIDADEAKQAVLAAAGGDLNALGAPYDAAKAALLMILGPGPAFLSVPNSLRAAGEDGIKLEGALADASTVAENLYLEYAEGMPSGSVGWGRAGNEAAIAAIMPLHDISADLMRRTPYIARRNGALLARAVMAALGGNSALPDGGYGWRLTAIAGHDTNLSNLAGILGVDWTLPDQPDKTAPGAALVFELWRDAAGPGRFVRVALVYQTLDQLRREARLDHRHPARRVDLAIPGCDDGPGGACRLATFQRLMAARLPDRCRAPPFDGEFERRRAGG